MRWRTFITLIVLGVALLGAIATINFIQTGSIIR